MIKRTTGRLANHKLLLHYIGMYMVACMHDTEQHQRVLARAKVYHQIQWCLVQVWGE